ncbi:MAG: hypothetical protein M9887_00420 [Chitinophagales bacterium]|nr:hypothetical protein [Chitinophagales bacterium]
MKILLKYLLFFVLVMGISISHAQTKEDTVVIAPTQKKFIYNPDHFVFGEMTYGYAKLGHLFHGALNYKYRFNLFKISYVQVNNFNKNRDKNNHIQTISFLYGWSFRKNNFLFSASFGIGGNWGNAVTNLKEIDSIPLNFDRQIKVKTVGFPIEASFAVTPKKIKTFSSVGIALHANFNNNKAFIGGGLNFTFGKVSPKIREEEKKNPLKDYYQPKDNRRKWYD